MQTIWPHHTFGNPNNPPVIFLHGFMGHSADWQTVCSALENEFFCLVPDLPGHGENTQLPQSTPINFDELSDGILDLLDHYRLPQAGIVGYSMGGRVALHTIVNFPERFAAYIVESASPGLQTAAEREQRLEIDQQRATKILQDDLPAFLEKWYQAKLFASLQQQPEVLRAIIASRQQNEAAWMAKMIVDLSPGRQKPLWQELTQLKLPGLILAGELDTKYCQIATQTAAALPNAQLRLIPMAGHIIHAEAPEAFINNVREFFWSVFMSSTI